MIPIKPLIEVTLKFKCHACDQECSVEQSPGQAINHRLFLGSRLFSVAEQLVAIKLKDSASGAMPSNKKEVPRFLLLNKEKKELESEILIWDPINQVANAILVTRGTMHCKLPDNKDPG